MVFATINVPAQETSQIEIVSSNVHPLKENISPSSLNEKKKQGLQLDLTVKKTQINTLLEMVPNTMDQ